MVSFYTVLLSTLSLLAGAAAAESGCRCGDAEFLAIPPVNLTATEQQTPCSSYKLIDARGSGEPQGISLVFQVALERILANDTEAVSQSVTYPAGFDQDTTLSVPNTVDIINTDLESCPDQKYFLLGYSQGATAVLEAHDKLDNKAEAAISGIVMVGNPNRIPGRASNVDGRGRPDSRMAFGLFAEQKMQANQSVPTYDESLDCSGKVLDISLELASDHMSYGLMQSVQDVIFNHVVSRV